MSKPGSNAFKYIGLWGHKPRNRVYLPLILILILLLILILILILPLILLHILILILLPLRARDGSKLPHSDEGARSNANSPVPPGIVYSS
jgi:hypothetical protein